MSERRHRQSAATKLPAGGRVPGHEGLRIVQLLPQDVRAGGDEGRGIDISWHRPRKLPAVSPPAAPAPPGRRHHLRRLGLSGVARLAPRASW